MSLPASNWPNQSTDPYLGKIVFGKYRCLERIGEGATCVTYKVQHAQLAGARAMKVLRAELRDDAEAVAAFWGEARLASTLRHPNLVSVHDVDTLPDAAPCSFWELVDGQSLAATVAERPLGGEVASLARGLCGALHMLHDRAQAHLDLYPGNIFINRSDREPRLLDLAEARPFGTHSRRTHEPVRIGYSAPEQVGNDAVDARADVFALGAVICFAVTGRPPITAPDVAGYGGALAGLDPVTLAPVQLLPAPIRAIVEACLAPDPASRPASAEAVRDAIRRIAREASGTVAAVGADPPTTPKRAQDDPYRTDPAGLTQAAQQPALLPRSGGPRGDRSSPGARLETIAGVAKAPFHFGHTATLGRELDNSIQIVHMTVSKHHAKIRFDHGEYFVEDLGSRNGTSINGRRVVGVTPVQDGDTVALGDVVLRFCSGA